MLRYLVNIINQVMQIFHVLTHFNSEQKIVFMNIITNLSCKVFKYSDTMIDKFSKPLFFA